MTHSMTDLCEGGEVMTRFINSIDLTIHYARFPQRGIVHLCLGMVFPVSVTFI